MSLNIHIKQSSDWLFFIRMNGDRNLFQSTRLDKNIWRFNCKLAFIGDDESYLARLQPFILNFQNFGSFFVDLDKPEIDERFEDEEGRRREKHLLECLWRSLRWKLWKLGKFPRFSEIWK